MPIGFGEFVGMMAAVMALTALAIDMMLPALPEIARAYALAHANEGQWIISAFMLGNAVGQPVYGPLSDRFGRRPILILSLATYTLFGAGASHGGAFSLMIIMRFLQGFAAAGARVVGVAIIRDRFSGARMARVMSLTFIVILMVPMLAPAFGQFIMNFAPWRYTFYTLAALSLAVLGWVTWRLPESLAPQRRRPLSIRSLAEAGAAVLHNRLSLGYTLGTTLLFGALLGYINSIQQIYYDIYQAPHRFPYMFACAAGTMAITALANSHIVEKIGMRRISHSALLVLLALSSAHWLLAMAGADSEPVFILMQSLQMGCFSLTLGNFNAIAMEPLGALAGSAASLQGFITTLGAALIGALIGQLYDHSTAPLSLGFSFCAATALVIVLTTESGRLFSIARPGPDQS